MKIKSRFVLVIPMVVIILLIGTFVSCPKAPAKKVVVTWWHLQTTEPSKTLAQETADAYMKLHPNVEIQQTVLENEAFKQKIATMMQSGSPPDIFQSWGGGVMIEYAQAGLLKDISKELKGEWMNSIGSGALGLYSYDGKYYGVPYDMGAVGFWYNKELFAKVGYNKPPATTDEFVDLVTKLKKEGITPVALGEGDKWPGHFWWVYLAVRLGGKPAFDAAYSRKGAFTDAPFVKAGEMLLQLIDMNIFQEGFLGAIYSDQAGLVANEKAAMELMGQWGPGVQNANAANGTGLGDKLGFFPFPMVPGGAGLATDVMGGGNGYAVGKNASKEAIDFLKYATGLEVQKKYTAQGLIIPTVKGAEVELKDPMMREVQSMVAKATYYQLYYDQYLAPAVGEAVKDATQALFAKTATAQEAAAMIEKAMKEASGK